MRVRARLLVHAVVAVSLFAGGPSWGGPLPPAVRMVKDIAPGPASSFPHAFVVANDTLFFEAGEQMWKSDGTDEGTTIVWEGRAAALVGALNGIVFFQACESGGGCGLWQTDGTAAPTKVVDINAAPDAFLPGNLGFGAVAKGLLFFAADDGVHGTELWRTDGTAAGTMMVKDINPGPDSSYPGGVALDGTLLFAATDGAHGAELWRSDGTEPGTVVVADIGPGPAGSGPVGPMTVSGHLLFYWGFDDATTDLRLFRSDGTAAGTFQLSTGVTQCVVDRFGPVPGPVVALDGGVLFAARDIEHGCELWGSDGTPGGTVLVKDIKPGPDTAPPLRGEFSLGCFARVGNIALMCATDGLHGVELWRSDGTDPGTQMVRDLVPGPAASMPIPFPLQDSGLLTASDAAGTPQLWRTDGTAAGTAMVAVLDTRSVGLSAARTRSAIFFTAQDAEHGLELWRTVPGLSLDANAVSFRPGDALELTVTLANPGPPQVADLYVGVVLPPAAGARNGCPLGDAVAFFVDASAGVALSCLSSSASGFAPMVRNIAVPVVFPAASSPTALHATWPADLPAGRYVFFIALVAPGGLTDGRLDPADLLASAAVAVDFAP